MNFAKTQRRFTTLSTALIVALVLSAPALAATNDTETALARNERAAQAAISSAESVGNKAFADMRDASLAANEHASKGVIFDTDPAIGARAGMTGEATLAHNEQSAQEAIVDGHVVDSFTNTAKVCAAPGPMTTAC